MLRVVSGGRSTFGWKKIGTGIFVSSLVDHIKSERHWVSDDIDSNKKIWNLNDISINVYCIKKKKELSIFPIRLTEKKTDKHVNLLYVQNDDDVEHFAWIKNLSRLVSSQLNKKEHKKFFCDRYVYIK